MKIMCEFFGGEKFPPMKNISFRSHLHEIFTEQMWKVALSAEDDKRIVMADGIQTLAIGHWRGKGAGDS